MNQKGKRKITVEIAGRTLTLVTDECDSFVDAVVAIINEKMRAILRQGLHTGNSALDGALLCAMDACGERLKSEKRIRNLEAQISLYEVNIKNLQEELNAYRAAPVENEPKAEDDGFTRLSEMLRAGEDGGSAEDKIKTLERYLESKKSGVGGRTREEKIRYIESLLRGGEEDGAPSPAAGDAPLPSSGAAGGTLPNTEADGQTAEADDTHA